MTSVVDTTAREEPLPEAPSKRLMLQWVWPESRTIRLEGARIAIGRDASATICVAGPRVSRLHAELYRQGPLYVLRDRGSTNGTWLGGRRAEHEPVTPGSVLRVGDWVGVFVLREAEPTDSSEEFEFGELAPGLFGGAELLTTLAPVRRVARDNVPVSLIGATGVGKERFARALHHFSGRAGAFFAVNCAALPEQLAEAELFGYRKGAFTGAERSSGGHFRAADGGTLFLDEVADLSPALQSKLLRVLDDGVVLGLGESRPIPTDVRIVSASQRPLSELVAAKRFRQDLAARLSGLEVNIPPLASRRGDVARLFALFAAQRCGGRMPTVDSRLIEVLCLHAWPENVRELELLTRTLLATHGHEALLHRAHLPSNIASLSSEPATASRPPSAASERRAYDLDRIESELKRSGGNVQATARKLGLSRQRLYRVLEGKLHKAAVARDPGENSDDADAE